MSALTLSPRTGRSHWHTLWPLATLPRLKQTRGQLMPTLSYRCTKNLPPSETHEHASGPQRNVTIAASRTSHLQGHELIVGKKEISNQQWKWKSYPANHCTFNPYKCILLFLLFLILDCACRYRCLCTSWCHLCQINSDLCVKEKCLFGWKIKAFINFVFPPYWNFLLWEFMSLKWICVLVTRIAY